MRRDVKNRNPPGGRPPVRSSSVDPLTHTLVGANLAASRLGRTTRYAAAALVIGANLPDVDVAAYVAGSDSALAFRRGWTHGVPALLVWPFVLTVLLLAWGRLRRTPADARARPARLLGLSALGLATHPALDWLNNYGVRWWMPFDGHWSYGDSVFIMDPWLWILLAGPWLLSRRSGSGLLLAWAVFFALIGWVVVWRAPAYLPAVVVVAVVLLAAWRISPERLGRWRERLPVIALAAGALWIGTLLGLHRVAVGRVRAELAAAGAGPVDRLMVGPAPLDPGRWEIVAALRDRYRWGRLSLWPRDAGLSLAPGSLERPSEARLDELRAADEGVRDFLVWARFPWVREAPGGLMVLDARYARTVRSGFGATHGRESSSP